MRRLLWLLVLLGLPAFALSATELFDQVAQVLEQAPWEARLQGRIVTPNGDAQEADLIVKSLPEKPIVRIEFQQPDALADNYVVITPDKVYNYLFLTNQVVVYPREKARIEGLGFDLSRMGDLRKLGEEGEVVWGEPEKTTFEKRPAWHLVGRAPDPDASGFARVEVWIDREKKRPLRTVFYDAEGKPLSELTWTAFKTAGFSKDDLVTFPPDAEWIEKK
ncbi:MAG TPA: outer membrane lipoprotein carrier protein LolA [Oceanithermus profundus]|uniref:Outer membrane lipoprotein carrier protein LolA n=1 Tax=Oceanithermus profundus TaxID=187137 RepID=A0A7C4Z5D4_9DEIN|nr:outer membrane lipoprotein carrier protein LolA [Oceanithermus profundus]